MKWFLARMSEPSSHGGIAAIALSLQQILAHNYTAGVPGLLFGLMGILVPEKHV